MALTIYCYQVENPHGWTEFVFTPSDYLIKNGKNFVKDTKYTLALRKEWTLPLPQSEKSLLKVTCDDAWIDSREDKKNFNIVHVKNPTFDFIERKS